ncbi:UNVERIFIED_CONTAM: hypothetical protein Sindi_2001100 [Sesamum indicum]
MSAISKEIAEAFLYAESARDLWVELEMRFGDSNGPLLYQIQREIATTSQKNMTVAAYFTKLKKLWDELGTLDPLPVCTCGTSKKLADRATSYQLIQFLVGLSDAYEHVKNQILLMDPLPTAAKAYSMVQRVEKQRELNSGVSELDKEGVMVAQTFEPREQEGVKGNTKKWTSVDKRQLQCEHCKKRGHSKEGCFELIGYPDWYKAMLDQRKAAGKPFNPRALNVRTEQELSALQNNLMTANDRNLTEIIKKEVLKVMQDQSGSQIGSNFSDFQGYAGKISISTDTWIIDSGASAHMCASIKDLKTFAFLTKKSLLNFPMDLWTKRVMAIGKQQERLYVLEKNLPAHIPTDFRMTTPHTAENMNVDACYMNNYSSESEKNLWHYRLGHTSIDVLRQMRLCKHNTMNKIACETCALAKQHRMPFPDSENKAQSIFELIHIDVWGPYRNHSINSYEDMLTIVDDFSRKHLDIFDVTQISDPIQT